MQYFILHFGYKPKRACFTLLVLKIEKTTDTEDIINIYRMTSICFVVGGGGANLDNVV